jgi:hypothetical protein
MDAQSAEFFTSRWAKYFPDVELPIGYYYTDHVRDEDLKQTAHARRCMIGNLERVRDGFPFVYDATTPGCAGGKRYTGFTQKLRPNFEYFLSCGIPGQMEGERYKKSPEMVREYLAHQPAFVAPGKYLVFKRWDKLAADEQPLAVIFFASADVLSGLFTLANYDAADNNAVIAPMGSGCASIISYPMGELHAASPKCVLGMFDVSARPEVPADSLTFTAPMSRFEQMVANMDESFLITVSWNLVMQRLGAASARRPGA